MYMRNGERKLLMSQMEESFVDLQTAKMLGKPESMGLEEWCELHNLIPHPLSLIAESIINQVNKEK